MRFKKYRCVGKSPFEGECLYDTNGYACNYCGITFEDQKTIWDKIDDIYISIVPYEWRFRQVWYGLKCRFWHRYTTIKPRKLDHTWCDRSHLLPHMMFEILCQFVERELCLPHVNWESDERHSNAKKEMLALHKWWTEEYDNLPDDTFEDDYRNIELLRQNCRRIIDVSPFMWT